MQLKESATIILKQLKSVVSQLNPNEFNANLDLLSGNSLGKHIRHVLEFFDLLLHSESNDYINYDERKHDPLLESDINVCIDKINKLIDSLYSIEKDKPIQLQVAYSTESGKPTAVNTSINRELAYNIEHAIHHMAIVKIAVITVFPKITLPQDFGVAYSTIRFQKAN